MDAAERIEDRLPIPAHLEAIFMDGTALGGARPKASVRDEHGVLWLAKFSSRQDSVDVPAIEYAALRLAAKAGLTVPPVDVRTIGARKVMLIRRFCLLYTSSARHVDGPFSQQSRQSLDTKFPALQSAAATRHDRKLCQPKVAGPIMWPLHDRLQPITR